MQAMRGVQGVLGIPAPINEPMFSTVERDRRWGRLRALMDEEGVELLIVLPAWVTSDSLYIADTIGVTIFPREGDPILILGGEHSNYAVERPHWIDDRMSATPFGSTAPEYGLVTAEVLRRRGLVGRRTAIAGLRGDEYSSVRQPEGYAAHTTVSRIAEAVGGENIVDGTAILGRARYVKGVEEIARLAASVRVGEASLAAMADSAREGVAQAEVFGQMLLAQVRAGCRRTAHRLGTRPLGRNAASIRNPAAGSPRAGHVRRHRADARDPGLPGPGCPALGGRFSVGPGARHLRAQRSGVRHRPGNDAAGETVG